MKRILVFLILGCLCLGCSSAVNSKVTSPHRPVIVKKGTIGLDIVETSPVVFRGTLYRFEYIRKREKNNKTGDSYFRFVDHETGESTPAFAHGYHLGSAFVDDDKVYVTGTNKWGGDVIDVFVSDDLENWQRYNALTLPGYKIYNTSICKAEDEYVLMFEIGAPKEVAGVAFTGLFAKSKDMKDWEVTEHVFFKEKYIAPHCLRYLDGYFYNFYVEYIRIGNERHYETYVMRSKDLDGWESSPLNPVLRESKEDKQLLNPNFTAEQIEHIAASRNVNNSDFDFCEYEGKLIINYSWGDQVGTEFLAEAVYEGSLRDFLLGWFPE